MTATAQQLANIGPHAFKSGAEWKGNAKGRPPAIGLSIREWWNELSEEDKDGNPKFTLEDLKAIVDAPDNDPKVSQTKRIAAQHLVEMGRGGRTGREISSLVFDRTEGKPQQSVNLTGGPEQKRIILVDERVAVVQEALPEAGSG